MKRKPVISSLAIEFLPKRFFFLPLRETQRYSLHPQQVTLAPSSHQHESSFPKFAAAPGIRFVSLDEQTGQGSGAAWQQQPTDIDMHQTIAFYDFLTNILRATSSTNTSSVVKPGKVHYFYLQRRNVEQEIRVIHLICRWRLLYLQLSPQEAIAPFEHLPCIYPRVASSTAKVGDASSLLCSLVGIAKGIAVELFGQQTTGLDGLRCNYHKQVANVENGAMTWITERFLVFAGPHEPPPPPPDTSDPASSSQRFSTAGSTIGSSATAETLAPLLKQQRVSLVIRLNHQKYNESHFTDNGIELVDLSASASTSEETSCLDEAVLMRFLDACESKTIGGIAVHSATGSGRAVAYIGCYLMKHFRFTSREAVGWIRFCRPGSLSRAHQYFLDKMQSRMWHDGEAYRRLVSEASGAEHSIDDFARSASGSLQRINIGKISLGRDSLFGTKDKHAGVATANGYPSESITSREPHAPDRDPHAFGSAAAQNLKQRPFTQGSGSRRRILSYRHGEGGMLRADFALMHKFLHQTGSTASSRSPTATPRSAQESASLSAQAIETTAADN